MADSKITALTAISTVDPTADPLVIVDVSDTSMAASGTTKKSTINQLLGSGGTATLASATITGDLTVDTNTLKVDSANNAVGVGTASPTANTLTIGANRFIICSDSQSKFGDNGLINGAAADGNTQIQFFGSRSLFFNEGVATRMTLNATGLGVGASPSHRLTVSGTAATNTTGLGLIGTTTGYNRVLINNTSGGGQFGVEGSSGGNLCVGSTAYSTVVGSYQNYSLHFITNNTVQATLDASGNLMVGTTSGSGSSSNSTLLLLGGSKTASGSVSATTAVATTIFSITAGLRGRYEVMAMIPNSGDAAQYAAIATVIWDGSTGRAVSNNGSKMTITLSGSDVQITQSAGSTQSVNWSFHRFSL